VSININFRAERDRGRTVPFAVSTDAEGNPALYAVRQRFSKKKERYVNDVKGKDRHAPVAKTVTLEEASGIVAAGLERAWSGND